MKQNPSASNNDKLDPHRDELILHENCIFPNDSKVSFKKEYDYIKYVVQKDQNEGKHVI